MSEKPRGDAPLEDPKKAAKEKEKAEKAAKDKKEEERITKDFANKKADFYDLLGVNRSATEKDIRAAGRDAMALFHPDRRSDTLSTQIYARLKEAKETLEDKDSRAEYDKGNNGSGRNREREVVKENIRKILAEYLADNHERSLWKKGIGIILAGGSLDDFFIQQDEIMRAAYLALFTTKDTSGKYVLDAEGVKYNNEFGEIKRELRIAAQRKARNTPNWDRMRDKKSQNPGGGTWYEQKKGSGDVYGEVNEEEEERKKKEKNRKVHQGVFDRWMRDYTRGEKRSRLYQDVLRSFVREDARLGTIEDVVSYVLSENSYLYNEDKTKVRMDVETKVGEIWRSLEEERAVEERELERSFAKECDPKNIEGMLAKVVWDLKRRKNVELEIIVQEQVKALKEKKPLLKRETIQSFVSRVMEKAKEVYGEGNTEGKARIERLRTWEEEYISRNPSGFEAQALGVLEEGKTQTDALQALVNFVYAQNPYLQKEDEEAIRQRLIKYVLHAAQEKRVREERAASEAEAAKKGGAVREASAGAAPDKGGKAQAKEEKPPQTKGKSWAQEEQEPGKDEKRKEDREAQLTEWIKRIGAYAYSQFQKGANYAAVLSAALREVDNLSPEEQRTYRLKVEKAVEKAFEKNKKEKKTAFDTWARDWFANLQTEVKTRFSRGETEEQVRDELGKILENNLRMVVDEDDHHAQRGHMKALIDVAIGNLNREKNAHPQETKENPADIAFGTWATNWIRDELPNVVRTQVLTNEFNEEDVLALVTAMLGSKRGGASQGVFDRQKMNTEAIAREIYKKAKKEEGAEVKEDGRERFMMWYHEWILKVPGMAREILEKVSGEEMRRRAGEVLEKKMDAYGLQKADRDIVAGGLQEVLAAAEMMDGWFKGILLVAGQKLQMGENMEEVRKVLEADCEQRLKNVQISEHGEYRKKLAGVLEKMQRANDETIGKGMSINEFYLRMFKP